MKIKKIAIVGAGTAGWLAANHLGYELRADPDVQIVVIESADVPTIGVGEGTVPYIMKGLERFGINEAELLLQCDTTFKQGIKFVNWLDKETHGDNHFYHPFDSPYPAGFDITSYWLTRQEQIPFDDVGIQARFAELGLAPKTRRSANYQAPLAYAYHFNALKFAALLAKNARQRYGVQHQVATVTGAKLDDQGLIRCLTTRDGTELTFDFYVDCSGFSSVLIDKTLQVPFISKADQLLTDRVLVQQVPLEADAALPPYTTATAHSAGWIWDIPLTTRRGTGFVYSSKHLSDDDARRQFAAYLGVDNTSFAPRQISMPIGYRSTFWQGNCVALGLAQGFVEPLEATSILVTDFAAEMLARHFPRRYDDIAVCQPYFNKVLRYVWDGVIDFIKLHYFLSDRQDSAFWQENRDESKLSEQLKNRLAMFRLRPPQQSDFFSRFDLFNEKNFLYVLYGMKFKTNIQPLTADEIKQSETLLLSNQKLVQDSGRDFILHRTWLKDLQQAAGLQAVICAK
ncbi:tryptophan halogenase family protein [Rheinheimera gaetbuli]